MKVKIRYKEIIHKTDKAYLFLFKNNIQGWIPKSVVKLLSDTRAVVPKWVSEKYNLEYKEWYHIPDILPIIEEDIIEELRYNPENSL